MRNASQTDANPARLSCLNPKWICRRLWIPPHGCSRSVKLTLGSVSDRPPDSSVGSTFLRYGKRSVVFASFVEAVLGSSLPFSSWTSRFYWYPKPSIILAVAGVVAHQHPQDPAHMHPDSVAIYITPIYPSLCNQWLRQFDLPLEGAIKSVPRQIVDCQSV